MKAILWQALLIVSVLSFTTVSGQTVSDEAKRHFDRGMAAVETAAAPEDYETAIREFQQAAQLAPDWSDVYFNLGLIQEKAGKVADAVASLRRYLQVTPDATDAEEVKSKINKLEFMQEKERGVAEIFKMMVSDDYQKVEIRHTRSGPEWIFCLPMDRAARMNAGKLEIWNMFYRMEYHPELHPHIEREYEPVEVNGRFYSYSYQGYMDISSGYTVREDVHVKGEVISTLPPRVKETVTTTVDWGVAIPDDEHSNGRPWNQSLQATNEIVSEFRHK